eukprot:Hpha_TRINITY_DN15566_c1_g1::TRINITY_DN15566_c1_g1_i3::g.105189::m.105189
MPPKKRRRLGLPAEEVDVFSDAEVVRLFQLLPRSFQKPVRGLFKSLYRRNDLLPRGCLTWLTGLVTGYLYSHDFSELLGGLLVSQVRNAKMKLDASIREACESWVDKGLARCYKRVTNDAPIDLWTSVEVTYTRALGPVFLFFYADVSQETAALSWINYVTTSLKACLMKRLHGLGLKNAFVENVEAPDAKDVAKKQGGSAEFTVTWQTGVYQGHDRLTSAIVFDPNSFNAEG